MMKMMTTANLFCTIETCVHEVRQSEQKECTYKTGFVWLRR